MVVAVEPSSFRRVVMVAAVSVVLLAGCSDTRPVPSDPPGPELQYSCGTFAFAAEALATVPQDSAVSEPAQALARYLVDPDRLNPRLPLQGWRLLGSDDRTAEFASVAADASIWVTVIRKEATGWVVDSPDVCQPVLVLPGGLARADWTLDPAQGPPTGATRVFDALVTETGCNSGQPADGRIVGPKIVRGPTDVLVVFAVRPRGGAQRCPSNPATRVPVDLGESLGPRRLLDGGHLPWRDPTARG